jgi:hypothetical protein
LIASRADTVAVLRDQSRGSTGRRVALATGGLVVVQLVVTCVLLVGSLLQVRSIVKQQQVDFGYDTRGVLSARIALTDARYESPEARKAFYDRLLVALRNSPDFGAAAITTAAAWCRRDDGSRSRKVYEQRTARAGWEKVSSGFAETIGQRVIRAGRSATTTSIQAAGGGRQRGVARRHFGRDNRSAAAFEPSARRAAGPWRTIVA